MSHGSIILFNISFLKLSELSPSWVLNMTEILESLLTTIFVTKSSTVYWNPCCLNHLKNKLWVWWLPKPVQTLSQSALHTRELLLRNSSDRNTIQMPRLDVCVLSNQRNRVLVTWIVINMTQQYCWKLVAQSFWEIIQPLRLSEIHSTNLM